MIAAQRAKMGAVRAVAFLVAGVGAVAGVMVVATSPATASTPPSTTGVPAPPGAVFTDEGGSFEVRFTAAPAVSADPDGVSMSYLVNVDEDSETVSVLTPAAFGAAAGATAAERVLLFLDASGDELEVLANTQTRLGPFPAAYFISRITLVDGKRAVLYGVAAIRPDDVSYVVYTDVGGDDADRARAFVESYTVVIDPLPAAQPPTTTTTSTTTTPGATTTTAPAATTTTIPVGATASFDGRWWVRFPEGARVSLRASSEDGFAYAEYLAVDGDDTLTVRVTELPAAFEWDPADAATADAERSGATVVDSEAATVGGAPGTRVTFADADSDTSADTTEVLLVRAGGQLYRVAYADGGESSPDAAADFIDSFHLR